MSSQAVAAMHVRSHVRRSHVQEINVRRIQHGGAKHGETQHGETMYGVAKHWEAMPRCGEEYEGYRQWSY